MVLVRWMVPEKGVQTPFFRAPEDIPME